MEASTSFLMMSNSSIFPTTMAVNPRSKKSKLVARRGMFIVAAGLDKPNSDAYGGRLVDEGMVQLRKRIHELKMLEGNYEAPSEWAEWEKRYYTSYESAVCQAVGALQAFLMNARPSQAIAGGALVVLSVPTTVGLLAFYLVHSANIMMSGIHF